MRISTLTPAEDLGPRTGPGAPKRPAARAALIECAADWTISATRAHVTACGPHSPLSRSENTCRSGLIGWFRRRQLIISFLARAAEARGLACQAGFQSRAVSLMRNGKEVCQDLLDSCCVDRGSYVCAGITGDRILRWNIVGDKCVGLTMHSRDCGSRDNNMVA